MGKKIDDENKEDKDWESYVVKIDVKNDVAISLFVELEEWATPLVDLP